MSSTSFKVIPGLTIILRYSAGQRVAALDTEVSIMKDPSFTVDYSH